MSNHVHNLEVSLVKLSAQLLLAALVSVKFFVRADHANNAVSDCTFGLQVWATSISTQLWQLKLVSM